MKIKNISVQNFKAVSQQSISFDGCSAIITAGNNKGKTSILRGLIDRFRGEKVDMIVKEGEVKGFNVIELTDGCKIEWKFTEKTESFAYTTSEGIRMTQGVLSAIGQKYFGIKFDIDKFLSSGPQFQTKELQKIVGLDFEEIDARYTEAYGDRTYKNKLTAELLGKKLEEPVKVEDPKLDDVKTEKKKIDDENTVLREKWVIDNQKHREGIIDSNDLLRQSRDEFTTAKDIRDELTEYHASVFGIYIDFIAMDKAISTWKEIDKDKPVEDLKKPDYAPTDEINKKVGDAEVNKILFDNYSTNLKTYNDWIDEGTKARENQVKADEKVKAIQVEKNKMIAGASIPKEFSITEAGILYNGFTLSDSQISSSSKYIAALKLGAMVLGSLRTMHFDASFLDKNSLAEIQKWANENDLQLLIERPDFDGGEIKYQIIEE